MKKFERLALAATCISWFLATVAPLNATMLVPRGSTWKYHNLGVAPPTTWAQRTFDDSTWGGPLAAPLGDNNEAGTQMCSNVITIGDSNGKYPVVYYRRSFNVVSAAAYQQLTVRLQRDDSAVVYLNGTLLVNDGVTQPGVYGFEAGQTISGTDEVAYHDYFVPGTALVDGVNVLAVENHQVNSTSSDLQFDLELEANIDDVAPTLVSVDPSQGSSVLSLSHIGIVFSESVLGVNAGDLLINGAPAASVVTNNLNDYTFFFTPPPTGQVQVAFSASHGITDSSPLQNAFTGGSWNYTINPALGKANIVISEFLADNNSGIKDDDGQRNDWLELYNSGPIDGNLDGWFLTDTFTNLTKWRIPGVALGVNNYVLIWCSGKNRTNLTGQLHTSFKLQKEAGGYLALVDPQTNLVSVFTNYPVQSADISYGRDRVDPTLMGYLSPPTPGAQNSVSGPGFMGEPVISMPTGIYTNASLTVSMTNTNGAGTIRYTTDRSLPTSASTVYTTPITISGNSTIKARVFPPGTTNLLPSPIVARNYIFIDTTATNFTSRLPLMIISTEGTSIPSEVPPGGVRAKGSIAVIDTYEGRSSIRGTPDFQELAEFEIFGQTSAGFAKKPIRVEIQDSLGNDLDTPVLGMPADSDWKLRNPYNDKTLLNDYLGFEMWEKMGHYSVRRKFVDVFVDTGGGRVVYPGDYYGVMVLTETIKVGKDRVDIAKLSPYATNEPAVTGGYIIKRDKASVGDIDFSSVGGGGFSAIPMKLHAPKPNNMRYVQGVTSSYPGPGYTPAGTNQMNYLRGFLGAMERALYTNTWTTQTGTNHYSYYIDVERFADQFLHVEFTKQIDGYRLSDYFSKDRLGKFGPGPVWDWNLAFGNANYATGGETNGWYYEVTGETDHPWARRLVTGTTGTGGTSGDPNFLQLIADRWCMFRTNVLNGTNVNQEIDQWASILSESAARDLYGKYRSSLIGLYTWPNPDGGIATAGSLGAVDGRDVDYVRPTNYLGAIETVAPSTTQGSIIGQMKKWVLGRYLWMDSQFVEPPAISTSGGVVTNGYLVRITAPPGVTTLYYTTNGTDPRLSGGGVNPAAVSTTNRVVTITVGANMRVVARAQRPGSFKGTWGGPAAASLYTAIPPLRITEIMYHPAPPPPGSLYTTEDFEYIEVKNIGATSLNVANYRLTGGVDFVFPNMTLAAGQYGVVVANAAAFQSRYGSSAVVLGTYTGRLGNGGNHITLLGPFQEVIEDFSYSDSWYMTSDGLGFSLVATNETATSVDTASAWRPSAFVSGSPGLADPAAPVIPPVIINEILGHTDPLLGDAVELYNPTANNVDIGGWFLTDDFDLPKKYMFPLGTTIPANGYRVFYESNSFGLGLNAFALSSHGEEVYLLSGNSANLTGYGFGFDFGASASNTTVGRYVISTGEDHFVVQSTPTLGGPNAGPLVGPVIVNEINYHPADVVQSGFVYNNLTDEYIELRNTSSNAVPLYDPAYPTNRWRLTDAVQYTFPTNTSIAGGGFLLVVGFDPADAATLQRFRNDNLVPPSVPIFGPWSGHLENASARVELRRPDVPDTNGVVSDILVERVHYQDDGLWPAGADGLGLTLQRLVATSYANDPTNWTAAAPTPGANLVAGVPPVIVNQPGDQSVPFGSNAVFTVTATGDAPLRYQWRFNGVALTGATNATLVVTNVQTSQLGVYNVIVFNGGGYALATNFTIRGRVGITAQPVNRVAQVGQTTNFTVTAVGSGVLRYQWTFNGSAIATGTNNVLIITNVQTSNQGTYTVLVSDDFDTTASVPVTLTVVVPVTLTLRPFNMTIVEGSSVGVSVSAIGTPPIGFRWRSNGITFTNAVFINNASNSTMVLNNIGTNYTGVRFSVALTNAVPPGVLTTNFVLTVLVDSDHDGLPDEWETGRPGFDPLNPSDGARDDDGDGMSNAAEYIAGTDPFDPTSYLRVSLGQGPSISFDAVSNRTYSVQYSDEVPKQSWNKLGDVLNTGLSSRPLFSDPAAGTNRFYRVVIPAQP